MCAAHWEALQGLMERGGYAELGRLPRGELTPSKLVEHLSTLALHGPPALALCPGLQDMLSCAASLLPQVTKIVPGGYACLPLQHAAC